MRGRRGAPLWAYLTALVLVPLIGVVLLTVVVARSRMAEAAGAARTEQAVQALADLDRARTGVEQEVLPTYVLAVLDDPTAAAALGLAPATLRAQRAQALVSQQAARHSADQALARATDRGGAAVQSAVGSLQAVRAGSDSGQLGRSTTFLGYLAISNELMSAQRSAATAAGSGEISEATAGAVQDVQLVAQLASSAVRQMPLYFSALFPDGESTVGSRLAWQTGWLDYTDARAQLDGLSQPDLRAAWSTTRSSTVVTELDGLVAPGISADPLSAIAVPQLAPLLYRSAARDVLLSGLVDDAVDDALTLAAEDRDRAAQRRTAVLLLGAAVLVLSVLGALLLGRTVSRSLRLLAGQAGQVSRGELVQVRVGGPRELRTVSAALSSAVASLRRIQDQARAVARGDLSNALLDEPLPGPLGEVVHASVRQIVRSVRQREELQSALAHQATHDQLTALPNRGQALQLTTAALSRAQRSGSTTGLLYVDLDGFKAVNDNHGHAAGDDVLREVASRLRDEVRAGDVVCRLGGDEFVVVVEPVDGESDLLELASRLIGSISDPIGAGGHVVRVGASIGVAVSRDGIADAEVLLAEADTATYRAKRLGRGRAEVFDDVLRAQLADRAEMEAAIAAALVADEMELHYQPVVDLSDGRVSGYEALIRWQRPGHGRVAPDEFIPVAEASRLICDVDRWVLREATRQLAEWRDTHPRAPGAPEPTMAVNISGRHLADRQVVQDVADVLAASGLPAGLLVLEVTETVLVDDPAAIENLAALRALGAAVAIDDFGTGYTSIGQLRHMPVDTLKIDRSFIGSSDPGNRELVALMIRAAHTFGLTVVAEGVEEPAQLVRLAQDACDSAQGFFMYRPLPAAEAGALLSRPQPVVG